MSAITTLGAATRLLAAIALAVFVAAMPPAHAQTAPPQQPAAQKSDSVKVLEDQLSAQRTAISAIKREITEGSVSDERLTEVEVALRGYRKTLLDISQKMQSAWSVNLKAVQDLGPAPKKDDPPEAETIAKQRQTLTEQQKRLDNLVRGSDIFASQASRLIEVAASLRRERFYQQVFTRQRPPFSQFLWQQAANSFENGFTQLWNEIRKWVADGRKSGDLQLVALFLGAALLIAGILFHIIRRWLLPRIDRSFGGEGERVAHTGLRIVARIGPLALAGVILLAALVVENLLGNTPQWFGWALLGGLLVTPLATTVRRNVVANGVNVPGLPPAGVLARPICGLAWIVIAVSLSLDIVLRTISSLLATSLYFAFAESFVFAMTVASMVLVLAWRAPAPVPPDAAARFTAKFWPRVRIVLLAAATLTILAELVGYLAFGQFLIRTVVFLAMVAAMFTLLRAAAKALVQRAETAFIVGDGADDGAEERPHLMFAFWGGLLVDIVLLLLAGIIVLLNFRYAWSEIRDWLLLAIYGFKIGNASISLINIGTAIAVFLVVVAGTRFIQRFFTRELLPRTRLDSGVKDSLNRFIGYAGLLVAAISAFATIGIDMSNLAIIAGALSLGVGFGLQSIVNNFVSGLILLFERPIKVGDWIVTESGEGNVRRIGVRSTMIETFDRTALIIPNSELVVSTVKNWTLNDRTGRHIISLGVSYDADPKTVEDILYACAEQHPDVLKDPAPYVFFKDFGASSLDFELRVYLRNIRKVLKVATALRLDIFARLKAAGIEIPFPQRDLHLKDIDRLEGVLKKPAPARRRK